MRQLLIPASSLQLITPTGIRSTQNANGTTTRLLVQKPLSKKAETEDTRVHKRSIAVENARVLFSTLCQKSAASEKDPVVFHTHGSRASLLVFSTETIECTK